MDENLLDALIREGAEAGATDVVVAPGTVVGKLIIRAAGETVVSRVVELPVLHAMAAEVGRRTHLPALLGEDSSMEASIGSFEVASDMYVIRVRAICTPTPAGPMMRLRLHARALLEQALELFRRGMFGGLEVLPHLHSDNGVIFVAGLVSAGKTSALHHLAAMLPAPRRIALVSEAAEFELPRAEKVSGTFFRETFHEKVCLTPFSHVVLDEMDETEKLRLAFDAGRDALVLATMASPTLAAALRRIRSATLDAGPGALERLIGVLRVGFRASNKMRIPDYAWYAVERHSPPFCPCCGLANAPLPVCPRCGNARPVDALDLVPRSVLADMQQVEAYRAAEVLEEHRRG